MPFVGVLPPRLVPSGSTRGEERRAGGGRSAVTQMEALCSRGSATLLQPTLPMQPQDRGDGAQRPQEV
jgi:hypothetical protein